MVLVSLDIVDESPQLPLGHMQTMFVPMSKSHSLSIQQDTAGGFDTYETPQEFTLDIPPHGQPEPRVEGQVIDYQIDLPTWDPTMSLAVLNELVLMLKDSTDEYKEILVELL